MTRDVPVETVLLTGREIGELGSLWDELEHAALEENPFFSRAYVLAGLRTVDDPTRVRALAAIRRGEDGPLLIALLPIRSPRFRFLWPMRVDVAALNVFQTSGTPLLHRDHAAEAADALLGAIAAGRGGASQSLLLGLRRDGPVGRLLAERAGRHGLSASFLPEIVRPVLRPGPETADQYLTRTVAPKRLRELRRAHRRLGEMGELGFERVREPDRLAGAVEAFLKLEAAGWKGRAGTAFASTPEGAAFGRLAFTGESRDGAVASADLLTLDGAAVAVTLNLQTARTSHAIKCTYDETFRRHAPGLVLEYLVIRHLFETRFADEIDSCTTEAAHVVEGLWNGRETVGTLAVGRPGALPLPFRIVGLDLAGAERVRRAARAALKRGYRAARDGTEALRHLPAAARRRLPTPGALVRWPADALRHAAQGVAGRVRAAGLRRRTTLLFASLVPPESELALILAGLV